MLTKIIRRMIIKKIWALLFALVLTVGMLTVPAAAEAAETKEEEAGELIEISTAEELAAVAEDLSADYILTADIDLTGMEWIPLGSFVPSVEDGEMTEFPDEEYGVPVTVFTNCCTENVKIIAGEDAEGVDDIVGAGFFNEEVAAAYGAPFDQPTEFELVDCEAR